MGTFTSFSLKHGCLEDLSMDPFPTVVSAWVTGALSLGPDGTHFGFIHSGPSTLECASGEFSLGAGLYFAVPGSLRIAQGSGIIVTRLGYRGFFHLGGPVEEKGRLRYIDGCTDSLLVPPVIRGEPCLNLLHIPPRTRQTSHTHPSIRVGLIIRGEGHCVTPAERIPLFPGLAFVIRAGGLHGFHTQARDLLVLAYHPESDFGPTDETHPMVNRTLLPETEAPLEA